MGASLKISRTSHITSYSARAMEHSCSARTRSPCLAIKSLLFHRQHRCCVHAVQPRENEGNRKSPQTWSRHGGERLILGLAFPKNTTYHSSFASSRLPYTYLPLRPEVDAPRYHYFASLTPAFHHRSISLFFQVFPLQPLLSAPRREGATFYHQPPSPGPYGTELERTLTCFNRPT